MKVGILTFHRSYNFGANLQALAMQSTLKSKGVSPIFINYQEKRKTDNYRQSVSKKQQLKHELFFQRYYKETPVFVDNHEVEKYCLKELDVVIVGSDAVFRLTPKYDPINIAKSVFKKKSISQLAIDEQVPPYWLPWTKKTKNNQNFIKASVAVSSMGTNFYCLTPRMIKELKYSLSDFDFVSVRDDWTKGMIEYISNKKLQPFLCPDPVFSLPAKFTIPDDEKPDIDLSKTILISGNFQSYWLKKFVTYAHQLGFQVASLPNPDNQFLYPEVDMNIPLPISPLEWFVLLGNASGYVGTRFHAMVSCLIQQTPFINVDNHPRSKFFKKGSKMNDLCQRSGTKNRYFTLSKIHTLDFSSLFNILFDKHDMAIANKYSIDASNQFGIYIDKILQMRSI